MKSTNILVCAALMALASPAFAKEDTVLWGTAGSWQIRIDTTLSNGCFIMTGYTHTAMRVGINPKNHNAYILMLDDQWRSLESGKEYRLSFSFDGEAPWAGVFTGLNMGGSPGLVTSFDKPKFLQDFATKQTLSIYWGDRTVALLPLTGSYGAVQSLTQCQAKVDQIMASGSDPFAGGGSTSTDPFSTGNVRPATSDPFRR
jgi:hypothetical protein